MLYYERMHSLKINFYPWHYYQDYKIGIIDAIKHFSLRNIYSFKCRYQTK